MEHATYVDMMRELLAGGVGLLPPAFRGRQADFILSRQAPDGGFRGRGVASDIYYTRFALETLAVLGLDGHAAVAEARRRALAYAQQLPARFVGLPDCFSYLHVLKMLQVTDGHERLAAVRQWVAACRTPDGGYSVSPGGPSSVYHVFLAALCYDLLGEPLPRATEAVSLILSRRQTDGGFADGAAGSCGQTNATAAAVAVLGLTVSLDEATATGAAEFLRSMQTPAGGLTAQHGAAEADLLSTFTGLWTLAALGRMQTVKLAALGHFVRALAADSGGFRGSPRDTAGDVEYTFYGVAALGVLAEAASGK